MQPGAGRQGRWDQPPSGPCYLQCVRASFPLPARMATWRPVQLRHTCSISSLPFPPLPSRNPCSIAALVQQHGWGDGGQWLANWEEVWQANLDACEPGPEGECVVS